MAKESRVCSSKTDDCFICQKEKELGLPSSKRRLVTIWDVTTNTSKVLKVTESTYNKYFNK
jgi:hypothetical protein